jgi:hypothetical protein
MRGRRGFTVTPFGTARGAGRLAAVAALMMLAVTPAICQSPTDSTSQAPAGQQAGAAPQQGNPNAPSPSRPGTDGPRQPTTKSETERLAVNPLTGMASVSAAHYVPLTGQERWKLYWKQNYWSVGAYFGPVFVSLVLDQTSNSPPEWGRGISGYGRRLASRTGNAILQGTFQATAAAALQEDVRYIPSDRQGGKRRVLHAIAYSFLTYNRRGRPAPNLANLGAYYASTAISTTWLPRQPSVARYTLTNGTEQIGLSVIVNLLQEFWPEITRQKKRRP